MQALSRFGVRDMIAISAELTLFGTAGTEPAWCDRAQSQRHKAIPLPSAALVQRFPMISEWLRQMGVDLPWLLDQRPEHEQSADPLAPHDTPYNVFHVADARGSTYIPEQSEFVEQYGVRSALGAVQEETAAEETDRAGADGTVRE